MTFHDFLMSCGLKANKSFPSTSTFDLLKETRENLKKLDSEKRMMLIRQYVKNPNFDDADLYRLSVFELQQKKLRAIADARRVKPHKRKHPCHSVPPLCISKGKRSTLRIKKTFENSSSSSSSINTSISSSTVNTTLRPVVVDQNPEIEKRPLTIRIKVQPKHQLGIQNQKQPIASNEHEMVQRLSKKVASKRPVEYGDEGKITNKKKRKKNNLNAKSVAVVVEPNQENPIPETVKESMNELGGSELRLVIEKPLFKSDINPGLGRLSIPSSKIKPELLTKEETLLLDSDKKIEAMLIEPLGNKSTIWLRKWEMTNSPTYNLVTTWNDVVKRNQLAEGMPVQLWSFRVDSKLWFSLVKL